MSSSKSRRSSASLTPQMSAYSFLIEISSRLLRSLKTREADVSIFGFQGAIERFQNLLVFFLEFSVADSLEKWLVIFVHQDDCPFSCRDGGASDDSCEPSGETDFGIIGTIHCLPTCQSLVENILQCRDRVIVLCIEIKMEDRMPLPLPFERGYSQPVEELLLPLEVCLERADEQALAEPSRTAEEIVPTCRDQPVHKGGLVHIEEPVPTQALEILYTYRIKLSHNAQI